MMLPPSISMPDFSNTLLSRFAVPLLPNTLVLQSYSDPAISRAFGRPAAVPANRPNVSDFLLPGRIRRPCRGAVSPIYDHVTVVLDNEISTRVTARV